MGDGKDAPPYGLLHEGRGPRLATLGRLRGAQRDPYSPVEFTYSFLQHNHEYNFVVAIFKTRVFERRFVFGLCSDCGWNIHCKFWVHWWNHRSYY